jgi:hypothetical protein
MRLVLLGLLLGGMAAVAYHFTATSPTTGWFAYAPLSESVTFNRRPSWLPTAVVGPVVGGFIAYSIGTMRRLRRRV